MRKTRDRASPHGRNFPICQKAWMAILISISTCPDLIFVEILASSRYLAHSCWTPCPSMNASRGPLPCPSSMAERTRTTSPHKITWTLSTRLPGLESELPTNGKLMSSLTSFGTPPTSGTMASRTIPSWTSPQVGHHQERGPKVLREKVHSQNHLCQLSADTSRYST